MRVEHNEILKLAEIHFGISGSIKKLHSEVDLNFYLKSADGKEYILKIANVNQRFDHLEFQNEVIKRLSDKAVGLEIPNLIPSLKGESITTISLNKEDRLMRLLTWVEGRVLADVNPHTSALLENVGGMCGKLCAALKDFDHPEAHRFYKWDPSQAYWIGNHQILFTDSEQREIVNFFFEKFNTEVKPTLDTLRKSVNYNDANDYNILISHDLANPTVPGVIDFGDAIYTNTINELAILLAYILMNKPDPLQAAYHVVKGFHQNFPLQEKELEVLFTLTAIRLCTSVTCSAINIEEHPENTYLQISDKPAWDLLKKLRNLSPTLAHVTFRDACGFEPHPNHSKFQQWAKNNTGKILSPVEALDPDNIHWLDLGVGSLELGNYENIFDSKKLNDTVDAIMQENKSTISLGKYNEVRGIYTTTSFASEGNDGPEWRTVHMGIDFFTKAGTPVVVPVDGIVHSFLDNQVDRDYGPTIILEHRVEKDFTFYTLYGHLDRDSLKNLKVGATVTKGSILAHIGNIDENGGWPPHLHFQIMLDDLDNKGNFPGVANFSQRSVWKSICPDPMLLLSTKNEDEGNNEKKLIDYRKKHLGKNLSLSYRTPLHMVRGMQQYLIDATGRRYLDTVNNVAHVGHEHPRVVKAGQQQMAVLNTNTRYLHKNIIQFAEAIIETMPAELNVVYVVNSGSEANELALRIAKNYTQQKDMVVVETGYHGNTNACVEISSYKFDGPGGKGAADHIHVVPMPDTFRGTHRNANTAGKEYAGYIKNSLTEIQSKGKNVAAFICESVLSCGGQIELPQNYLRNSYELIRKAGGVCIADEVQTGCGRAGNHFWAFQEHDVVPDIVTIGKPIGNGHPLGVVVTTQKMADAFKNGMEYFNTFGGNPVSTAIGVEVLNIIKEEGLQKNAAITGQYLKDGLHDLMKKYPVIGDVRGPGLFLGIELIDDLEILTPATKKASYLANRMRELGILMSTDGPYENVLKIKPPIIFNRKDSDFLLETLDRVFQEDFMKI